MSKPKVSVIGAGNVGAEVGRRIIEKDLADVVLVDIAEGLPQGKALDMMQAGAIEKYESKIIGSNDYLDTKDSDVVVITAGLPRKPGMSRDDLLQKNAQIMKSIIDQVVRFAPKSKLVVVSNPLDVMTYLAWKLSKFDTHHVIGMAASLDAARMAAFIAMETNTSIKEVDACVLGSHGNLMVPLPRYTTVKGKPINEVLPKEKIDQIVERTKNGGAEIVKLLKTGSAFYAPSACAVEITEAILHNTHHTLLVAGYLNGEYGLKDLFLGVPAKVGANGIEQIMELDLTPEEKTALQASANTVKENIAKLGL